MTQLYWIFDNTCDDPTKDGYIGVSENATNRLKRHKKNHRVPSDAEMIVLFEGSRDECFNKEYEYRPEKKIGWNNAVGGKHGYRTGFTHSPETKLKLKNAWTDERKQKASEYKPGRNKNLIGKKRPNHSKAISGENNGMYGKTHSPEARAKISTARKGKEPHNKIDYYCIFCRKRIGPYVLKKYHGIGKKSCISK